MKEVGLSFNLLVLDSAAYLDGDNKVLYGST